VGALVALHWLTFYGAIKLANASVAATCIALAAPMTALVEPWLTRTRFSARDLLLGLAVLPGVALVVGGVPSGMRDGIIVGAISALLVAIFGSLNKRLAHRGEALTATGLELGAGLVVLTVLAPLLPSLMPELAGPLLEWPEPRDAILLVTLALACTLLPFSLSFVALRHISAFSAQLAINLEPVYTIVLAVLLLGEQRELTVQFYVGVAIILAGVSLQPLVGRAREVAVSTGA
jgi:drug/metabolite transporter (DMT)-like permease